MKNKLVIIFTAMLLSAFVLLFSCGDDNITVSSDNKMNSTYNTKPILKIYIENSGSMDGYMCDGSQLKDAIFDYVSDLGVCADTTELYYINNQTIPYNGNLEQYIKTMNPATFKKLGGNRANSDLSRMVNSILNGMTDSTVCLFVSDCILDLPVSDSQKFLNTCQISIKNAVNEGRKKMPNLGVEIIKMESDFNGFFFYQNGGRESLKDVKRPYYIWVLGNNNAIAKLNTEVSISMLEKHGFKGIVSYSPKTTVPYDIKNNALTSTTIKPTKGDYKATIRADFRSTLQPETVIQNLSNYTFNNSALIVEDVKPITATDSRFTHFIKIIIPKDAHIAQENLILKSPQMPVWVSESDDETGSDIKNNLGKTTGIKYLIEGVADAYKKENILTTLNFTVKRK